MDGRQRRMRRRRRKPGRRARASDRTRGRRSLETRIGGPAPRANGSLCWTDGGLYSGVTCSLVVSASVFSRIASRGARCGVRATCATSVSAEGFKRALASHCGSLLSLCRIVIGCQPRRGATRVLLFSSAPTTLRRLWAFAGAARPTEARGITASHAPSHPLR